jgi:hypothetical protein
MFPGQRKLEASSQGREAARGLGDYVCVFRQVRGHVGDGPSLFLKDLNEHIDGIAVLDVVLF